MVREFLDVVYVVILIIHASIYEKLTIYKNLLVFFSRFSKYSFQMLSSCSSSKYIFVMLDSDSGNK